MDHFGCLLQNDLKQGICGKTRQERQGEIEYEGRGGTDVERMWNSVAMMNLHKGNNTGICISEQHTFGYWRNRSVPWLARKTKMTSTDLFRAGLRVHWLWRRWPGMEEVFHQGNTSSRGWSWCLKITCSYLEQFHWLLWEYTVNLPLTPLWTITTRSGNLAFTKLLEERMPDLAQSKQLYRLHFCSL